MIAKDIDYLTILEASLKIREIDYVYTLPMYAGELKHGTLSLVDENSVVLSLNTDKDISKLHNAINEIQSRGGRVIKMEDYISLDNIDDFYKTIYSIISISREIWQKVLLWSDHTYHFFLVLFMSFSNSLKI